MDETHIAYQPALRAVGAFLDEVQPYKVRVIEVPEGFEVHWQVAASDRTSESRLWTLQALMDRADKQRRKKSWRPFGGNTLVTDDRSYENVLRALGYELETAGAYGILIDELEDRFLISYQFLNPSESYLIRKHMALVGSGETFQVLSAAEARRHGQNHNRTSLLAG